MIDLKKKLTKRHVFVSPESLINWFLYSSAWHTDWCSLTDFFSFFCSEILFFYFIFYVIVFVCLHIPILYYTILFLFCRKLVIFFSCCSNMFLYARSDIAALTLTLTRVSLDQHPPPPSSILVLTGSHLCICNSIILLMLTNITLEQHIQFPCVWLRAIPTKQKEIILTHIKLKLINKGLMFTFYIHIHIYAHICTYIQYIHTYCIHTYFHIFACIHTKTNVLTHTRLCTLVRTD